MNIIHVVTKIKRLYASDKAFKKQFDLDREGAVKGRMGAEVVKNIKKAYGKDAFNSKEINLLLLEGGNKLDEGALEHIAGGKESHDRNVYTSTSSKVDSVTKKEVNAIEVDAQLDGDLNVTFGNFDGFK